GVILRKQNETIGMVSVWKDNHRRTIGRGHQIGIVFRRQISPEKFPCYIRHLDRIAVFYFDGDTSIFEQLPRETIHVSIMASVSRFLPTNEEAAFFSFGTNDLTQMTFGFSRDDSDKFLKP